MIEKIFNGHSDWSRTWSAELIPLDQRTDQKMSGPNQKLIGPDWRPDQRLIGPQWRPDQRWSELSGDLIKGDRTQLADLSELTEVTVPSDLTELFELTDLAELPKVAKLFKITKLSEITQLAVLTKVTETYELVSRFKVSEVRDILLWWSK